MYRKFANALTRFFVKKKVIPREAAEVYAYGFEILLSIIVYESIFILISIFTNTFIASIGFWISFFFIRTFCGGFHANSYLKCHLMFLANHLIFIFLYKYVFYTIDTLFISAALLLCTVVVFFIAPVDHPNKPFLFNEYKKFKRKTHVYCIILVIFAFVNVFLHLEAWGWGVGFGTLSATISLIFAKLLYKKERRCDNEKVN